MYVTIRDSVYVIPATFIKDKNMNPLLKKRKKLDISVYGDLKKNG